MGIKKGAEALGGEGGISSRGKCSLDELWRLGLTPQEGFQLMLRCEHNSRSKGRRGLHLGGWDSAEALRNPGPGLILVAGMG